MRKIIVFLIFLLVSGCAVYQPYTLPVNTGFVATPEQYEILGNEVMGEVSASYLFGFLQVSDTSDTGVVAAYKKALAKKPGANILLNVKSDVGKLNLYIFSSYSVRISGIPARLKSK